jgi:hypothetical protein
MQDLLKQGLATPDLSTQDLPAGSRRVIAAITITGIPAAPIRLARR